MNQPQIIDHGSSQGHPDALAQARRRKFGMWLRRAGRGVIIVILLIIGAQYMGAAKYDALVQVIDRDQIGVNPSGKALDFGDLPRNKTASRVINLNNSGSLGSFVYVWKRGEIADLIKVGHNNFVLEPGKSEKLELSITIPDSAEFRYYRGKVAVFKIPKVW